MEDFLELAYIEAEKAYIKNEVPIGAVIVKNNKVISKGHNIREKKQNALFHAEIIAINKACKKLKSWRLDDCEIYVTLKPCPMCAGAIANARIKNIYFGAENFNDNKLCETILNNNLIFNHKTNLIYLNNNKCKKILTDFFKNKRQ